MTLGVISILTVILNLNDCVLDDPSLINIVKKTVHTQPDILLTQFSYADFAFSKSDRRCSAERKLNILKNILDSLDPKFIIPFASFVYFSAKDNFYMNDSINTIDKVFSFIKKNSQTTPLIMKPNQIWDGKKNIDCLSSLKYWSDKYNLISAKEVNESYDFQTIKLSAERYKNRIYKNNSQLLLNLLTFVGLIPAINFYIYDIKTYCRFSFSSVKILEKFPKKDTIYFVKLKSDSIKFLFDYN